MSKTQNPFNGLPRDEIARAQRELTASLARCEQDAEAAQTDAERARARSDAAKLRRNLSLTRSARPNTAKLPLFHRGAK